MGDPGNVFFPIQNRLIQMGNAPPLGDIETKQSGQFRRGLSCDRILPGAEGNKEIPVLVKGQIAVHHGGDTHSLDAVPIFNSGQCGFQTCPDFC